MIIFPPFSGFAGLDGTDDVVGRVGHPDVDFVAGVMQRLNIAENAFSYL